VYKSCANVCIGEYNRLRRITDVYERVGVLQNLKMVIIFKLSGSHTVFAHLAFVHQKNTSMKIKWISLAGGLAILCLVVTVSCKKDAVPTHHSTTSPSDLAQSDGLVMTPYGKVPANKVFQVDNQSTVKLIKGHLQIVELGTGRMIRDLGIPSAADLQAKDPYQYALQFSPDNARFTHTSARPSIDAFNRPTSSTSAANIPTVYDFSGYYTSAPYSNIQSFTTTWVIPNKSLDTSASDIVTNFLWNGLDGGALQPVMQWDNGYGSNYTLANWYFTDGSYFHGTVVPVLPGTSVTGVITFVSNTNDTTWTYKEQFLGVPSADVTVTRTSEATGVVECWEAYTQLMNLWPNQPYVAMKDIGLTLRSGSPTDTLAWAPGGGSAPATPTGLNTVIANNSSSSGEVDFYFGDGTGITPDSTYQLVTALTSSSVLDVTGGGASPSGTKVELWAKNSPVSTNQVFQLVSLNNGYYKLIPQNATSLALNVVGNGTANGTQADVETYTGATGQQWKITYAGSGYCTLSPRCAPSSSLDVYASETGNGTKVEIWSTTGNPNQEWQFVMQ
jgi:hypothetical protein